VTPGSSAPTVLSFIANVAIAAQEVTGGRTLWNVSRGTHVRLKPDTTEGQS
jgi:hypothetical protein